MRPSVAFGGNGTRKSISFSSVQVKLSDEPSMTLEDTGVAPYRGTRD